MKKISRPMMLHTLIKDLSSEEYHGHKAAYSSSQLKDMLEDEDLFIAKHVTKEIEREESDAFDLGTYVHTAVLEPHKLKDDCVVYPGKVRRGKGWEEFKKKNAGKAIITTYQKEQADNLVKCVKECDSAQEFLTGRPEISLFVKLGILDDKIYAPHFEMVLTPDGWMKSKVPRQIFEMTVKVRADMLHENYISDLKTTGGNAKSNKAMKDKVSYYNYDLSASLYLDIFKLVTPTIRDFVWIFASKEFYNCRPYRASEKNILVGRAKWRKTVIKISELAMNGWKSLDFVDVLEPSHYELEHLKINDIDLI